MFRFDPDSHYMMPTHFGPWLAGGKGSTRYNDVTTLSVGYLTDRDRLARYLPEPFEVGEKPMITVSYSMNRGIEWLAGRCYNIVAVNAAAAFHGQVDHVVGNYCLVMWENLTDPILTGREMQGIPKIYAEIQDHTVFGNEWRTTAGHWGHTFMELSVRDPQPVPEAPLAELRETLNQGHLMGWKYIPKTGVGSPGAEVSHATLFPMSTVIDEAWAGEGEVTWRRLTWEQNPTQHHIVNALQELPILEYRFSLVLNGSIDLVVPGNPMRALR